MIVTKLKEVNLDTKKLIFEGHMLMKATLLIAFRFLVHLLAQRDLLMVVKSLIINQSQYFVTYFEHGSKSFDLLTYYLNLL